MRNQTKGSSKGQAKNGLLRRIPQQDRSLSSYDPVTYDPSHVTPWSKTCQYDVERFTDDHTIKITMSTMFVAMALSQMTTNVLTHHLTKSNQLIRNNLDGYTNNMLISKSKKTLFVN